MTRTTIHTSARFSLVSFGGGTAYLLSHQGATIFVQGDDAGQLREDLESIAVNFPNDPVERCLSRLWAIYEDLALAQAA
jgi:hypothetical protein